MLQELLKLISMPRRPVGSDCVIKVTAERSLSKIDYMNIYLEGMTNGEIKNFIITMQENIWLVRYSSNHCNHHHHCHYYPKKRHGKPATATVQWRLSIFNIILVIIITLIIIIILIIIVIINTKR